MFFNLFEMERKKRKDYCLFMRVSNICMHKHFIKKSHKIENFKTAN